jgi:alkylhydroperoxidase family enzyme
MTQKQTRRTRRREALRYIDRIIEARDLFRDAAREQRQREHLCEAATMDLVADALHELMNTEAACYILSKNPLNEKERAAARNTWEATLRKRGGDSAASL